MKKIIIASFMAFIAILSMSASAQTPASNEETQALESAHWYIPLSYAGFNFEIPAGSLVDKGSKIVVKYPDGSFGVSMENEEFRSGNQKIAFEKARSYAKRYELQDAKVTKVTIDGVKGAQASGMLENHLVTILILPVNDQQLTTVIMATPNRQEWADHFLGSLKR